jgi:hypothetical protein
MNVLMNLSRLCLRALLDHFAKTKYARQPASCIRCASVVAGVKRHGDIVDWATRTSPRSQLCRIPLRHSVRRLAAQHHWTASTPTCSWTGNYLGRILKVEKPAIRWCSGRPASRSSST